MASTATRVLFVDDEAPLLELLRELMSSYAGESWVIHTATSPAEAFGLLQKERFDLLVIDIHMPVVDGVQFLKLLHRRFPGILKVVLTGDTTGAYRTACLNGGAELYLEKPRGRGDWQSIYATLNELVSFIPQELGFRGVLRKVGLQDIVQIECLSRNSSVLEVIAATRRGLVFIRDGQIVHAEDGEGTGVEAFFRLFAVPGGEFNLKPFTEPEACTIQGFTWEGLLMEAAQARDEASPQPPSPPEPMLASEVEPAVDAAADPGLPLLADAGEEERRPQVAEMLICSPRGEVLYDWPGSHNATRIRWLSGLIDHAASLAATFPVGAFEGFEAVDAHTRLVVQRQPAHTTMVLVTQVPVVQAACPSLV